MPVGRPSAPYQEGVHLLLHLFRLLPALHLPGAVLGSRWCSGRPALWLSCCRKDLWPSTSAHRL